MKQFSSVKERVTQILVFSQTKLIGRCKITPKIKIKITLKKNVFSLLLCDYTNMPEVYKDMIININIS